MRTIFRSKHREGSAMIMALTCAAILAGLSAAAFVVVQSKSRVVHQAASWKESLLTAESGVEMAMNEIRKNLYDPTNAWQGWVKTGDTSGSNTPGATSSVSYEFTSQALLRKGEGGERSWAKVKVDAPVFLQDSEGEQWFRIRSLGIADVPGGRVVAGDSQDLWLRKLDLVRDRRTGKLLTTPQSGRLIEAIAKPVGAFRVALFGISSINMTDQNILVDSYDSRDSSKSTNGGYDVNKRQQHADVATNGQLIDAGNAHIYGNAMTNGGSVLNPANVTGEIRSDFYQEVFPVVAPAVNATVGTPTFIDKGGTVVAQPGSPSNYILSKLTLSGQEVLRIQGGAGPTYVQIIISGDLSITGQAQIKMDPGVYARIFVKGSVDVEGNGFLNPNSPLALQFYGCDQPRNADGSISNYGSMTIAGNGGFCGGVYAPTYNITLKGGGKSDTIFGAFVGNTCVLTGVQSVHYDEAMADGGLISDYKIVSWFEDER